MSERIVLDPAAVADPGRTEIVLTDDAGAIRIASEGPSWGEATVETFMAEAEYGSSPVDRTYPTRTPEIPLLILDTDDVSFDQGRRQLQEWVGLVQETGRGWIERETANGSIYYDVVRATLRLGGDSLQAWGQVDANAALQLEVLPDGYGDEVLLGSGAISGGGVVTLASVPGDYSARLRVEIRDTSGNAQRSLLYAVRPSETAPTAAIDYAATALTPLGGSVRTGYIDFPALPPTWVAVLSTDVNGVGKMSHIGPHRVWCLASASAGTQMRLEWGAGSSAGLTANRAVTMPSGAVWVDLGAIQADLAQTGAQQWEGRILANGTSLRLYRVLVLPTGYASGYVHASTVIPGPSSIVAWDTFSHAAGTLDGKRAPSGIAWAGSGSSAGAFLTSGSDAYREATADAQRRFATLPVALGATDVRCTMGLSGSTFGTFTYQEMGVVARYIDTLNYLSAGVVQRGIADGYAYVIVAVIAGVEVVLAQSRTMAGVMVGTHEFRLVAEELGTASLFVDGGLSLQGQHAALASRGALASGAVGLADFNNSRTVRTRRYSQFFAGAAAYEPDAVLHAGQMGELSTAGYRRAASDGEAFARLPPIGTLPRGPVGEVDIYMRAMRSPIGQPLPSATDSDGASLDVFVRPCYLFTA